ncbi:MAG: ABC transporter permease [Desulfurococcaceae archaeon]|nr:ABC transporter permease [Desulfurococcaceae archaeon]
MVSKYVAYVVRRVVASLIAIFAIMTINFILFRVLPGDPIRLLFRNPRLTLEQIRTLERQFGLDKSLLEQFFIFLANAFQGNLGLSFFYKMPVTDVLIPRIINTVILVLPATITSVVLGVLTGMIAAWRRASKVDVIITTTAMGLYSLPTFWLGGVLILLSIYYLKLPISGMLTYGVTYPDLTSYLADFFRHFILPYITLTLVTYGEFTIILRSALIDVLTEDYIMAARAQGLPTRRILGVYALRNAMLPTVSIIAINLGLVVAGAVLTETVFSWPGVGRLIYDAILNRDYPILQGAFIVVTVSVVLANFIADIIYGYLDPRVRR